MTGDELEKPSNRGVAVVLTISIVRMLATSQSARVAEKTRTNVKVAGSMLLSFNAARHKSELLAKAIIASSVRMKIRAVLRKLQISNLTGTCSASCAVSLPLNAILLLDFFPEPTPIWNVRENKLALVESERIGAVVATER